MTTLHTVSFKRTVLATLISLCISRYAFALQEISDDALSQATGEGVAILPTDFSFVLRGDKTGNEISLADRSKDTGYIHYVPVGGLTSLSQDTNKDGLVTSADHSVGKADLYLYGLALSKNDNNINNRFGSKIASWGTANNPWIFKAATASNVPDFAGSNGTITYLNFEAPLYETGTKTGLDAYNLKLALWADAFVRDQSKAEGDVDQFNLGENFSTTATGRANRLRLQAIANGFSMNGSNLQVFQTLGGSNNNNGMSAFYNNTLGIAGVLRFNSGDAQNLKATFTDTELGSVGTPSAWTTIHNGQDSVLGTSKTASTGDCGNAGTGAFNSTSPGCLFIVQKQTRTDTRQIKRVWSVPTNSVLRLSTRETTDTAGLSTPALNGTGAPTFDANEGVFIYNPNINLVLGNLFQPVILGSDGKNFSLEIARIPNKPEIYKKIYTDYSGTDATYLGSTCNVYQCGTSEISGYQGGSPRTNYSTTALSNKKLATHSSISIGSVYSSDGGKTLTAYKGTAGVDDAVGISFGNLQNPNGFISNITTNTASQIRYAQREMNTSTWITNSRCTSTSWGSCNGVTNTTGSLYQWQYYNGSGSLINSVNGWTNTPTSATLCTNGGSTTCNNSAAVTTTPLYGTVANRTWSDTALNGAGWRTAANANLNNFIGSSNGTTGYVIPATNTAPAPIVPNNNMGSAVIDGLLIQHLKITTTGL
ncbi:MAG: hypothetical protein O2793_12635 [Proteobacteria bacterium]|uniref:hypothetical protein n=1 Tax=Acinetobacter venetianus TaxID=52133 RepID=UPI0010A5F5CB|nr:hypothetical protein [Acinetobacter venetianus]MCR4531216.1 hypothetical protein [Acinetobacter venetianus]MDA0697243.1 hypothetical protein [Pseudomonadota bacterium]